MSGRAFPTGEIMFKVPNEFRNRTHPQMGSNNDIGNNGLFQFQFKGYNVRCIASDGKLWDHISVTIDRKRTPSWEIMAHVKDLFWDKEDGVFQFHPPKSKYVNTHPYCLHLWRSQTQEIILPDRILIG